MARRAAGADRIAPDRRLLWLGALAALLVSAVATLLLLRPADAPPEADQSQASYRAAWLALEQTAAALELFELREGRYPDRLDELVPQDLPDLPADPFGRAGAPLAWGAVTAGPATHVLYSLGPDRIDQQGRFFDPVDRSGDLLYPVR